MRHTTLPPAAQAFDSVAHGFDERFGVWESVAAQRRAVRAALLRAFRPGARLLEIGGGTGEDALWLAQRGREVLLTDPSPSMVAIAGSKLLPLDMPAPLVVAAEQLGEIFDDEQFPVDGAFSNFAALNCVLDLEPVARALAKLVRPGGRVMLVLFGTCAPGEWITEIARGNARSALRRRATGDVPARIAGNEFIIRYHRERDLVRAFAPGFRLMSRRGIGVFVPPSAAEPWITGQRMLLSVLEGMDDLFSRPLAQLGDHVLYELERTGCVT